MQLAFLTKPRILWTKILQQFFSVKSIFVAFSKYFEFVSYLRSRQFLWICNLSHYSEVFEEKMDIDVFSICNGNCSYNPR